MTFIPVNLDDAVEPKPVPNGRYQLQITGAEVTETGSQSKRPGSPQFRVSIGFVGDVNAPNITHFISLPHEDDEAKTANFKALNLKRFLHLFRVPYSSQGIDLHKMAMDMVGATAEAEVTQDTPDDKGNVYNRLVVPRLKDEASDGRGAPPRR